MKQQHQQQTGEPVESAQQLSGADNLAGWAESFHFSDELKALEAFYFQQHHEAIEQDLAANMSSGIQQQPEPVAVVPAEEVSEEDALFLKRLSEQISSRLGEYLARPEVMAQYLRLTELEHDNQVMAHQIKALKTQLETAEKQLEEQLSLMQQYKRLFGNLYLKIG